MFLNVFFLFSSFLKSKDYIAWKNPISSTRGDKIMYWSLFTSKILFTTLGYYNQKLILKYEKLKKPWWQLELLPFLFNYQKGSQISQDHISVR